MIQENLCLEGGSELVYSRGRSGADWLWHELLQCVDDIQLWSEQCAGGRCVRGRRRLQTRASGDLRPAQPSSSGGHFHSFGDGRFPGTNSRLAGAVDVTGWAFDNVAVSKVDVYVDGGLAGTAIYGGPRPDVANTFPNVPTTIGYSFSLDTRLNAECRSTNVATWLLRAPRNRSPSQWPGMARSSTSAGLRGWKWHRRSCLGSARERWRAGSGGSATATADAGPAPVSALRALEETDCDRWSRATRAGSCHPESAASAIRESAPATSPAAVYSHDLLQLAVRGQQARLGSQGRLPGPLIGFIGPILHAPTMAGHFSADC
jgi:Bacterial Ig domain